VVKTLSYRVFSTLITMAVALTVTGDARLAAAIGLADTALKFGAYYAHERVWHRIPLGRVQPPEYEI